VALYPDVASLADNQFDGRNLLWRSAIRYGTSKIWYWPLLMTLAMIRLQILDDVSNLIQTRIIGVVLQAPPVLMASEHSVESP
jgi:hypothetical protein